MIETKYDVAGRMAGVKDQQSGIYYAGAVESDATNRIQYAAHGGVRVMKLGNGLWEHTDFNSRLQPTQIGLGASGTDSSTIGLTYNYGTTNNNGNVQSVGYSGGGLSYTQTFGYDQLNRLTTSVESGTSWSQTNSYDRYGNRSIVGGGLSFSASNNRITNAGYVYDTAGNLTNDGTQSFAFDAENKIKTVNGESDVYRYDGDGSRVRKNFTYGEKVRMVYSSGQLIAEYDLANGSLKKEYVYGAKGLIATIEPANGTRYTTADHLGTPRVVTNSSAGVVSRHDYMPFGEELGAGIGGRTTGMGYSVADGLRQKFTSKERDNETGLDFFEARYYASTQGRFTSIDPYNIVMERQYATDAKKAESQFNAYLSQPQQWNRYSYAINNPLLYVDPTGEAIQLSNDKDERARQMQALRDGLKEAGAYIYENLGKDGNYYVGIYENGPNGNGPAFEQMNEVAGEYGAIIRDTQVAKLEFVGRGSVTDDSGDSRYIGPGASGSAATPAVTGYFKGQIRIKMLDSSKQKLGYLPGVKMSDEKDNMLTDSVMLGHELGHGRARMTGYRDRRGNAAANKASVDLENKIRRLQFPNGPTRRIH